MVDRSTSSIVIDAPAEQIMDVIADVENYPDWTPGITEVELLSVYEDDDRPHQVRFVISQSGFKDEHIYTYDWEAQRVTWHLEKPAGVVQTLEGVYELTPHRDGGFEVTYSLAVDVSVPILGMLRRRAEKMIIDSALSGLRRRVAG